MKITKYPHSCLLIEEQKDTILIDPGSYTYEEKAIDLSKISKIDYLLITHSHQDHMSTPLIKEITTRFPQMQIISNDNVRDLLKSEGLTISTTETKQIKMVEANHGPLFDQTPPVNIKFDIYNKLTHPGDSLVFKDTREILALPIQAPWGSTVWAIDTAMKFRPKTIIPIHDFQWKDDFRKIMYHRLKEFFSKFSIAFMPLESGQTIEI